MPLKNGRLTSKERAFVGYMAKTSDSVYAATKARYSQPDTDGPKLMGKPAIKAEVLRKAEQILRDELLPLALATHKRLLTEANVPAGTQLGAVKLTYDQTLASDENKAEKEPSEMSYDELQRSIDQLKAAQDAIAGQARDVTPDDEPDAGIFG